MKKTIVFFVLIICALSLYAQEVEVKEVSGKVEYQIPGNSWKRATKGLKLPVSATIATGFQSRAMLESSRSSITVQPLTRLTIDELQSMGSNSRTSLSLRTGRISASIKKNESEPTRFQVKSPIATAAVRGTEFSFNGFQLSVDSGLVAFSGNDGRVVTVPLGGSSQISEDGEVQEVLQALLEEISVNPAAIPDSVIPMLGNLGLIDPVKDLIITIR